jgi:hypothetical protein
MRNKISEDCNNLLNIKTKEHVFFSKDLDCQNSKTRIYLPAPIAHTFYLDILFMRAVDIGKFIAGIGFSKEVLRTDTKSTVCRLIMGENYNYKAIFFDVNKARQSPTDLDNKLTEELSQEKGVNIDEIKSDAVPGEAVEEPKIPIVDPNSVASQQVLARGGFMLKIGGKIAEDIRMTAKVFNNFIIAMEPITDTDKCPQRGKMLDPFDNNVMPELSCPGGAAAIASALARGGRKNINHKFVKYTRKNKKVTKKGNRKTKKYIKKRS